MQMRLDLFVKIYKLQFYFFTFFFNQDFFLIIISITLIFGDPVDNVYLEGNVSQNFDFSPSFHFMPKEA